GPRHTVALQTVPFTLTVPTSWAVKTDAGRVVLTGPAPRGDVTVLLSPQPLTTAERINLLESGANKEASADPKRYRSAKLTKIGGVQVFERQTAGSTLPGDESATLRWTVTAFAPRPSNQFAPFELNFIGLTVAEYDAHGPFFRGIVESLAYDAGQDTSGI
ncbi:MAG TPA: hypothetical protein VK324_18145, partial [Tepidisphaeraceae bacterium]|nr:hypothetical protein [Tepidisphaeraceae bacterium]